MQPYYSDNLVTLYHGDCRAWLPSLSVDAPYIVTDPPFGVREDQEWDNLTSSEFARFSMGWLAPARSLSENLIAFCSDYGPFRQLCEMLYQRVRLMVWDKPIGSQYAGSHEAGLWFAHETILHCTPGFDRRKSLSVGDIIRAAREAKGLSRGGVDMVLRGKKTGLCFRWEEGACLPTDEQAKQLAELLGMGSEFFASLSSCRSVIESADGRDVFSYRTVANASHPCEKPLSLMAELIRRLVPTDATIVEPFAGSGATLLAAKLEGRKSVGIELDEAYCEQAADRLRQGVLFGAAV